MQRYSWPPGIAVRFAAAVGLISLVAALIVSIPTLLFAQSYLLEQRETTAVSRALVNGNAVNVELDDRASPPDAIAVVPSSADSQPMLQYQGEWFTSGVTITPDELPSGLLASAQNTDGAMQRYQVEDGDLYLSIAVPVTEGTYVENFQLDELDTAIGLLSLLLGFGSVAALVAGAFLGSWAAGRILRPLTDMAGVAERITEGDLSARVAETQDPDLAPIGTAFNDMAGTVEARLDRERRFSANVSHELRSPLTGILGTAELLEGRKDRLPEREGTLVLALVSQVRRFSGLVLDLLELSRIGGDQDVLADTVDVAALSRFILAERDLPSSLVVGGVSVYTDARRLERVLANLVDNAQAHGEGLRRIVIERTPNGADILVEDRGSGVAPEDRQRIFEPFNRGAKTDRKGSGLGLAIVTEHARLIGATVDVGDAPQGGARFTVHVKDMPWTEEP